MPWGSAIPEKAGVGAWHNAIKDVTYLARKGNHGVGGDVVEHVQFVPGVACRSWLCSN
jgi:hypothetical protein